MCASIIIDSKEFDQIDGHCTCASTWPEILAFIGEHVDRPAIGQKIVIEADEFDYVVTTQSTHI